MAKKQTRNGIALLLTVMFVIVISVIISQTLKEVNVGARTITKEAFMYQVHALLGDLLVMLQKSSDLQTIAENNSSIDELAIFLDQTEALPFATEGLDMLIEISSARSHYLITNLDNTQKSAYLGAFLNNYGVNSEYVALLFDGISGIKEDGSYNSAIFDTYPELFRDYIVSQEHLEIFNNFYKREYSDNSIDKIDFSKLFAFGPKADNNTTYRVDLNYATQEVWELLLGCSKERAKQLSNHVEMFEKIEDLSLSQQEKAHLEAFEYSFFEPYIMINIALQKDQMHAKVSFEYDIKKKRGYNFVYEI